MPPDPAYTPFTVRPIGRLLTPYNELEACPRGPAGDALGVIELFVEYVDGLDGVAPGDELFVLAWFHAADRAALSAIPPHDGVRRGVFACRAPMRPNPIALTRVLVRARDHNRLSVTGLDCLNGTALLDIKPAIGPLERALRAS